MTKFSQCWLMLGSMVLLCGCASFGSFGGNEARLSGDVSQRYQVEMSNMMGSPQIYQGQLEENMTVQRALEVSGAVRRYRNMDVSILRIVEGSGEPLKLMVQYQPGKKMVSPEQDYALLPGDRILVEPATGLLERMGSSR